MAPCRYAWKAKCTAAHRITAVYLRINFLNSCGYRQSPRTTKSFDVRSTGLVPLTPRSVHTRASLVRNKATYPRPRPDFVQHVDHPSIPSSRTNLCRLNLRMTCAGYLCALVCRSTLPLPHILQPVGPLGMQVLVNELRQPELEAGDNTNSLAVILADHVNGQSRLGEHRTGRRNRLPRSPDGGPTIPVLATGYSD